MGSNNPPPMTFHPALLPAPVACYLTQRDPDALTSCVDTGELLWVFDLSSEHRSRRLLRFWRDELEKPGAVRDLGIDSVLASLLPFQYRSRLTGNEFCHLASLARPQVNRLVHSGLLAGVCTKRVMWIELSSIREFLKMRLVR